LSARTVESGSDCGLDVLEVVARAQSAPPSTREALSISALAAATGRERSLVRRVVADLVALGLLEHERATGRLRLGWKLYVAAASITSARLATRAQPILDALAASSREAAYLVVRQGADAVTLAESTSGMAVQVVSWVGRSFPVVRSDAGPILLQDLTQREIHELVGGDALPRSHARNAPRDIGGLLALIEAARRDQVSLLDEQAEVEVSSAAAAVRDFREQLLGALVVSGPAQRAHARLPELARLVQDAARELSGALGASVTHGEPRHGDVS
jgi:DNA-binding IclR family transcriptional regulator